MTNIFEKILYAQKVMNDNLVVMNEKLDMVLSALSYEEPQPDVNGGDECQIVDDNQNS